MSENGNHFKDCKALQSLIFTTEAQRAQPIGDCGLRNERRSVEDPGVSMPGEIETGQKTLAFREWNKPDKP
jgi:hypothetical protein